VGQLLQPQRFEPAYSHWTGDLPLDFSKDFPEWAEIFLRACFDAEIPEEIGYSMIYDRIIFPIYREGQLMCWQGRGPPNHPQKWLTVSPKYSWGGKYPYIKEGTYDRYIITEDIISAMKVGEIYPTISILGASVNTPMVQFLLDKSNKFVIWLDGDTAGATGTKKILCKLKMLADLTVIRTKHDPKFYTLSRITQILRENLIMGRKEV
jgi:hypothetical protein